MPTCQILARVEDVETCGAGGKREMILGGFIIGRRRLGVLDTIPAYNREFLIVNFFLHRDAVKSEFSPRRWQFSQAPDIAGRT